MQPYLFPYLGHFQLMAASDLWVVFDSVKYRPKSWMNRNRILHPDEDLEWRYITIPVNRSSTKLAAKDVTCDSDSGWKDLLQKRFSVYDGIAPNYEITMRLINEIIDFESNFLSNIAVHALQRVASELGISTEIMLQSNLVPSDSASHPGGWAPKIAKSLGAAAYVNPESGRHLFRKEEFTELGISLEFLSPHLPTYNQGDRKFVGSLSILDVLMFNDWKQVSEWSKFGSLLPG